MLPRQPLLPPLPLTSLLLLLLLLLPLLKVTRQSSASRPPTPPTWSPGSWSILENHNPVEDLYQEGILVNNNLRRSTGGSKLLRKLEDLPAEGGQDLQMHLPTVREKKKKKL